MCNHEPVGSMMRSIVLETSHSRCSLTGRTMAQGTFTLPAVTCVELQKVKYTSLLTGLVLYFGLGIS